MENTLMTKVVDDRFILLARYKKYLAWTVAVGYSIEQDKFNPRCLYITNILGKIIAPIMIEGGPNSGETFNTVHPIPVGKFKCDFDHIAKLIERALGKSLRDPERDMSVNYPYLTYSDEQLLDEENYLDNGLGKELRAKAIEAYNTVKLDQLVNGAFDGRKVDINRVISADIKCEPSKMINRKRH